MEQIRSFIAIELPEEVRTGLKQIQDLLKSFDSAPAKWVDPQSIHLTLKFLGNVNGEKISTIVQAIRDAAIEVTPFELKVDGLGSFPNPKRVQVVWIGLTGELEKLQALQKNIELQVAPLGFPTEKRPFAPHLTLARVRESVTPVQRQTLGTRIIETQIGLNLAIKVGAISLMRSRLTPAGAVYTRLSLVELKTN